VLEALNVFKIEVADESAEILLGVEGDVAGALAYEGSAWN
jgi:hypothetical protein